MSLWRFENGLGHVDSIGTNTLSKASGWNTYNTSEFKEGAASGDFERDWDHYVYISNTNSSSNTPLKYNGVAGQTDNPLYSCCSWYQLETTIGSPLFQKRRVNGYRTISINISSTAYYFYIGYGGDNEETLYSGNDGSTITAGRWYHICATYNATTKAWQLRVWDDTLGQIVVNQSGTGSQTIYCHNTDFSIGAQYLSGSHPTHDGEIDEVVLFNKILTISEMDKIRSGTFGGGSRRIASPLLIAIIEKFDPILNIDKLISDLLPK